MLQLSNSLMVEDISALQHQIGRGRNRFRRHDHIWVGNKISPGVCVTCHAYTDVRTVPYSKPCAIVESCFSSESSKIHLNDRTTDQNLWRFIELTTQTFENLWRFIKLLRQLTMPYDLRVCINFQQRSRFVLKIEWNSCYFSLRLTQFCGKKKSHRSRRYGTK
jgi:hypothetical protein